MRASVALFLVALTASALLPAGDNMLANPGFDSDLSGWTLSGSPTPQWDPFDAIGASSSGSAFLVNSETTANSDVTLLTQCIDITAGVYRLALDAFIPDGQSTSGEVVLRYNGYRDPGCTGNRWSVGGRILGAVGDWQREETIRSASINQVGSLGSLEFTVAVRKEEASGTFEAYVDNALLTVVDEVHQDRFESP